MRIVLLLLLFCSVAGCNHTSAVPDEVYLPTKKDDSTACAYWKCSAEKKLYLQKYVKNDGGDYRSAGAYRLDQGVGAFPLEDLEKYGCDGSGVSTSRGFNPCPYCHTTRIGRCHCGKTLCAPQLQTNACGKRLPSRATCPWCGQECVFGRTESWDVGGGG